MSWDLFGWFAAVSLCLWGFGALTAWKGKSMGWVLGPTLAGLLVFFTFILGMWISLERPPMRTMGETRLWYSFFLPLAGIITCVSAGAIKWILSFSFVLSLVFICVNLFKPEIIIRTLMPALQSSLVCTTCHRIYVCLCHAWGSHGNGSLSIMDKEETGSRTGNGTL